MDRLSACPNLFIAGLYTHAQSINIFHAMVKQLPASKRLSNTLCRGHAQALTRLSTKARPAGARAARLADAGVVVAARADGERAQARQLGQKAPAAAARRGGAVVLRLQACGAASNKVRLAPASPVREPSTVADRRGRAGLLRLQAWCGAACRAAPRSAAGMLVTSTWRCTPLGAVLSAGFAWRPNRQLA